MEVDMRIFFGSLLVPPTSGETAVAVGQFSGFPVFPHTLSSCPASGPQYAVFSIDPDGGEAVRLVISANKHVAPFNHTWESVAADFLVFAEAEGLSLNDLKEIVFFKEQPGKYTAEPLNQERVDVWVFPNAQHPELQAGEIFLYNSTDEGFEDAGWATKRKGSVAYNIFGGVVAEHEELFPIFAQRAELLAAEQAEGRN